jgi:hypothetical protein
MDRGRPLPGEGPYLSLRDRPADIVFGVTECQVVPGETARFPVTVRTRRDAPSIHDLDVLSDNPNFDRGWAHVVAATGGTGPLWRYVLQVRPVNVGRHHYGTYPLLVTWGAPGTPGYAEGRCELVIKPCVRFRAEPTITPGPAGGLSLSIENCSETGIDISVTVRHHGSGWSRGWEFELGAGDGPFEFSETFGLPPGAPRGELDVSITAEGIPVFDEQVRVRCSFPWRRWARKLVPVAGVAVAGGLAVIISYLLAPGPGLQPQTIVFTSMPPTSPKPGETYLVTASGGRSGNPVTFAIDGASTSACSITGSTVTFTGPGRCVIDANQAGDARYQPAPQVQQAVTAAAPKPRRHGHPAPPPPPAGQGSGLIPQAIRFTSVPPPGPVTGGTYDVAVTGGTSGNPVLVTVDPSSTSACSIAGRMVTFTAAGTCVLDANQAGNARYQAARQAQQTVQVKLIPQTITFTSKSPGSAPPGDTYTVTATGGASGNRVTFTIDTASASVCSIAGATVTFNAGGTCVIDANQAGNAAYQPAAQAQQTVIVIPIQ